VKPTCDLCPLPATRWYEPGGHARCGLHEYNDAASVPLTRRPPPPSHADTAARAWAMPSMVRCRQCSAVFGDALACTCGSTDFDRVYRDEAPAPAVIERAQMATVRPPADERCPRCSRILIAAPCDCLTPAQRWVALQASADQQWRALTREERVEAIQAKAAAKAPARSFDIDTTHEGTSP